ncbi:MAG: MBOAT family protein [Verrucomicrobiales bacterium]
MLFNSLEFLIFLIPVYVGYLVLKRKQQNHLLLVASYVFYAAWDYRFLALIVGSTVVDYLCGAAIDDATTPQKRKMFLGVSLVANLGSLAFFKYFNFFTESLAELISATGIPFHTGSLDIILPIGISFYTFQTMSYTIDIYRGKLAPVKNPLDFALYVSFFPQLIAGPIERASRFLPQLTSDRKVDADAVHQDIWLILLGLYQKIFIADNLAEIVNPLFADSTTSGALVLLAIYGFAFQIYCDFAGYSNIARGLARLMGFDLMVNFNAPYFASSISDFWKRWHISLSSWLKDYLYIPLGGNRRGTLFTVRNLIITMLLGGLWHGAAGHFIVWGAFHGLLLATYHVIKKHSLVRIPENNRIAEFVCIAATFHLVCIGWLFFRAESTAQALTMLANLTHFKVAAGMGLSGFTSLAVLVLPLVVLDYFSFRQQTPVIIFNSPVWLRSAVCSAFLLSIIMAGKFGADEFIYFQF